MRYWLILLAVVAIVMVAAAVAAIYLMFGAGVALLDILTASTNEGNYHG